MFRSLWRNLFGVALLVGLIVGTLIGIVEGLHVLLDKNLMGQYNDLIAWAILIDSSILIAAELVLAVFNGLAFGLLRQSPPRSALVPLQLAETGYLLVLTESLWTSGSANPHTLATNPLALLAMPALVGLALGFAVLAIAFKSIHLSIVQHFRPGYWLAAEFIVIIAAIAFGLNR